MMSRLTCGLYQLRQWATAMRRRVNVEDLDRMLNINVRGVFLAIQAAAARLTDMTVDFIEAIVRSCSPVDACLQAPIADMNRLAGRARQRAAGRDVDLRRDADVILELSGQERRRRDLGGFGEPGACFHYDANI